MGRTIHKGDYSDPGGKSVDKHMLRLSSLFIKCYSLLFTPYDFRFLAENEH